jgi:hypothetical protein
VQSNRWRFLTCGFDDTERPSSQPIAFMYRRNGSAKVSSTSFRLGRNNNHRQAALLRARRERPCRRAAEERYELAPLHVERPLPPLRCRCGPKRATGAVGRLLSKRSQGRIR